VQYRNHFVVSYVISAIFLFANFGDEEMTEPGAQLRKLGLFMVSASAFPWEPEPRIVKYLNELINAQVTVNKA